MVWFVLSLKENLSPVERNHAYEQILRNAQISKDLADARSKRFERLSAVAVDTSASQLQDLQGISAVVLAVFGGISSHSEDGSWYVRLASSWEKLLALDSPCGGVVNMSLEPPSLLSIPNDPNEVVQRAARYAWGAGILPVFAAGNRGYAGDDSMSPWACSPHCVAVGAADIDGLRVSAYSGRGMPGTGRCPVVVAPESQIPPTGEIGTSFAAPIVSDIALYFLVFLLALREKNLKVGNPLSTVPCSILVTLIEATARPITGEVHVEGAGFVDFRAAMDWIRQLAPSNLNGMLGEIGEVDPAALANAQRLGIQDLVERYPVSRFAIDESFEWVRPMFVPGLYAIGDNLVFRQVSEIHEEEDDIEWVVTPVGEAIFTEITVQPWKSLGAIRRVGTGAREYATVFDAIEASEPGDFIVIPAGTFDGPVHLPSWRTLVGEAGSVLRSAAGPAITISNAEHVAVKGLQVESFGDREPAISIRGSNDVGFRQCTIISNSGNGINGRLCRRVFFHHCEVQSGMNGAYFGLGQELRFENTNIMAQKSGILFQGGAGWLYDVNVRAREHAVFYFGFDFPWRTGPEVTVFFFPFAKEIIRTRDVRLRNLGMGGRAEWLARQLFGLQLESCNLAAAGAGIVANDFRLVGINDSKVDGKWADEAIIDAVLTDEMRPGFDPLDTLAIVQQLLSKVTLRRRGPVS